MRLPAAPAQQCDEALAPLPCRNIERQRMTLACKMAHKTFGIEPETGR